MSRFLRDMMKDKLEAALYRQYEQLKNKEIDPPPVLDKRVFWKLAEDPKYALATLFPNMQLVTLAFKSGWKLKSWNDAAYIQAAYANILKIPNGLERLKNDWEKVKLGNPLMFTTDTELFHIATEDATIHVHEKTFYALHDVYSAKGTFYRLRLFVSDPSTFENYLRVRYMNIT